jgi:WD40 repeat protein
LVISVFPQLAATRKIITRRAVYRAFLKCWYSEQRSRLIALDLLQPGAELKFGEYAEGLAVALFQERTLVARYRPGETLFGQTTQSDRETFLWAPFFDDRYHPHVPLLRAGCPLQASGDEWSFLHKSIWEYYVARAMIAALPTSFDLLNDRLLNDEEGILDFVADALRRKPQLQERLFTIIGLSREDEKVATAATNAATLLCRAEVPFDGRKLHGVRIAGADLSGGVLDGVDLKKADLSGCEMVDTCLDRADLSGANLSHVNFGQRPYLAHEGYATYVSYSADGSRIALSTHGGQRVSLWDGRTEEKICSWTTSKDQASTVDSDNIWQIALSPDGSLVALGMTNGTAYLWDPKTNKRQQLKAYEGKGQSLHYTAVAFSPSGKELATGTEDGVIRIWDAIKKRLLFSHDTKKCIDVLAFSADGKQLISGSRDRIENCTVRVWDLKYASRLNPLSKNQLKEVIHLRQQAPQSVTTLVLSANGARLAAQAYPTIFIWDFPSMKLVASVTPPSGTPLESMMTRGLGTTALSPDGKYLAAALGTRVQLWALPSGQPLDALPLPHVKSVAFSPDGQTLATASDDTAVRLWQLPLKSRGTFRRVFHDGHRCESATSPDGRWLAVRSLSKIRVFDQTVGQSINTFAYAHDSGDTIALSAEGQLAVGMGGGAQVYVHVLDIFSGATVATLPHEDYNKFNPDGRPWHVRALALHPTGGYLASGGWDPLIYVWDVKKAREERRLEYYLAYRVSGSSSKGNVTFLAFSPDGSILASAAEDAPICLWNWQTGDCLASPEIRGFFQLRETAYKISFSPDGHSLATVDYGKLRIWQCDFEKKRLSVAGRTTVTDLLDVAFSSDSKWVKSVDKGGTVRLFDAASGELVSTTKIPGGTRQGYSATLAFFCANRQLLVSDVRLRVWDERAEGRFSLARLLGDPFLSARETRLGGVIGLSPINRRLLVQHGATA